MRAMAAIVVLATALAGCGPGDTRKIDATAVAAPQPADVMRETFSKCAWGEVKGASASIWSFACGAEAGNVRLVADDALPGFVIESTDAAAPGRSVAIRFFPKAPDAPIESILDAVRAASPGEQTATCAFTPALGGDHEGKAQYVLAPVGPARAAYDRAFAGDEIPEPPCGALGISHTGDRTFEVIAPDKVAFIEFGSEIQIFDATTLKVAEAAEAAH
jgi:hypothetical protein